MNTDEQREQFESWARLQFVRKDALKRVSEGSSRDDQYDSLSVQWSWEAWCAALAVVPLPEWRPIETAPKDGVFVLITDGDVVQIGYYEDHLMAWRSYEDQCRLWSDPTHWQPLPAPPERAGK